MRSTTLLPTPANHADHAESSTDHRAFALAPTKEGNCRPTHAGRVEVKHERFIAVFHCVTPLFCFGFGCLIGRGGHIPRSRSFCSSRPTNRATSGVIGESPACAGIGLMLGLVLITNRLLAEK